MSNPSEKRVTVAFDVAQTCAGREGCAWHADALAHALARNSGNYRLSLYHQFSPWINPDCSNGTYINGISAPFKEMPLDQVLDIWNTGKQLPESPIILHSNSYSVPPRLPGLKLIYTIHDLCFWTHPEYVKERNRLHCQQQVLKALTYADAFIFISHCARNDFELLFPSWLEKNQRPWKVIHSGSRFNIERQRRPAFNNTNSPWLYVGSIEPRKNILGLLKAYSKYYETSDIKRPLVIVGSAKEHAEDEIQAIVAASETLPITHLGYVSDDELQKLYQSSFALLHPSHYEGFGLPIIEAMGFGLPVISNRIPSVMEFASESALTLSFENEVNVAHFMLSLERGAPQYEQLQTAGYQTASAFTWENTATKTVEFYDEVLSEQL
ncbi:glycosyltransferase family 4 protein [Puniceicoccaceae bacterium K14]|nr:glycosyltransferase family 4 protein [Puniceicoccaceae bacterium K14]